MIDEMVLRKVGLFRRVFLRPIVLELSSLVGSESRVFLSNTRKNMCR